MASRVVRDAQALEVATPITFTATLQPVGPTATVMTVPVDVIKRLGGGKRPPVKVTINDYTYRNTIAVYGGTYMLGVAAEHRAGAKVEAGDKLNVTVELDTEERTVAVPADLADALDKAGVTDAFERLSYTLRKEAARSVEEAKKPETRQRRITKAVESLKKN